MNTQKLKVTQLCVFCSRSIRKGSIAITYPNKIFEHSECSKASLEYLGKDGVVERNLRGFPRCHICGWYREDLIIHIKDYHYLIEEDYRVAFLLDTDEFLTSFSDLGRPSETLENPLETSNNSDFNLPLDSFDKLKEKFSILKSNEGKIKIGKDVGRNKKKTNPLNKKPKGRRMSYHAK